MEDQGYPFKMPEAKALASRLNEEITQKVALVSEGIPDVIVPDKRYIVSPLWWDPDGINAKKPYDRPRSEFGEDYSRSWWGDVTVPKRTTKSTDPKKRGDRTKGAPYCKMKWREFSPTSRDHVRELLRDKYGWKPETWTDKGNPTVDDKVLRGLTDTVPHAGDLADIFTLQKLLGYIESGQESWIKKYNEKTGCIHPYTNTGGTVTGRCSHHGPNIAQVPSVQFNKDGPIRGLEGGYGLECRSLFHTPKEINGRPWRQVGVDLSGIEFRMLAEETARYDGGELIEVVLRGDVHEYNMQATGINDRAVIKRGLYGLLYGAGDPKLGATVAPDASPSDWKTIGKTFRSQLMRGLPALKKVIDDIKAEAERGYIIALDGRKIYVRSPHSALNSKLQSSAAIVAKRWVVTAEEMLLDAGLSHGWTGEFVFLAFVHDELQCSVDKRYAKLAARKIVEAAAAAGHYYEMKCPIDAESKIGQNWAECH
jgi:DNA polymerase I-like protein with 3'-5' exonuclease and polymerase domains